ncbi:MAG: YeeE/YedE thiosulfate transporter family protein [Bacillota bacterium]
MGQYALALVFGMGFGLALQKAGLSKYHKIVNVFRFKDMAVMKFMMTALIVGMVGVFGLNELGLLEMSKVNETYVVGNVVGGLIFGVGMAIGGL